MRPPHHAGLALLAVFAGFGCGDSHSSKLSHDMPPAVHRAGTGGQASPNNAGTGGHVSVAKSTGTGGRAGAADDAGTDGSSGTDGSTAPSQRGTCGCGDGDIKLECVCGPKGCTDADAYEARMKAALDCSHPTPYFDPLWSPIHHGCGLVSIYIGNGVVGTIRTYRESDHKLVGAATYSDDGTGCAAEDTNLSDCPDHSVCLPCMAFNGTDMCPDAESDAGL